MKILYLDTGFDSTSEFFRKEREKAEGCVNQCLYKKQERGIFDKIIQWFGINIFPPLLYLIYGNWKRELNKYDMYIIASRKSAMYAAKYIKRKTGKRVVIWYWNLVTSKELNPEYCRRIGCETWSFDKEDCRKYKMNFGDTYYFPIDMEYKDEQVDRYSVFYVGINRPGREMLLRKFGEVLCEEGISYKFNLTAIPTEPREIRDKYDRRLSYDEVLNYITNCDAILDLNRENQSGMTLRPLEALFFGKKLITNNEHIINYQAYSPENTFILKNESFAGIASFLKKEYIPVKKEIIKHYEFSSWLERIYNSTQADEEDINEKRDKYE